MNFPLPVIGFAAWSGTGKTTLLARLIPLLRARGLRIAAIKGTHHDVEIDQPGKDSHTLRMAGAAQVLLASRRRLALITELAQPGEEPPPLAELVARLDPKLADLVLVEGFKHEGFPKIEVHRTTVGKPLIHPGDPDFVAVVTDDPGLVTDLPRLPLDDVGAVAEFVAELAVRLRTAPHQEKCSHDRR